MDKQFEQEVIERLVRIETKVDDYESYKKKSEEADNRSKNNEKLINEIIDNNRWLRRAVIGAFITSGVGLLFLLLKIGIGV